MEDKEEVPKVNGVDNEISSNLMERISLADIVEYSEKVCLANRIKFDLDRILDSWNFDKEDLKMMTINAMIKDMYASKGKKKKVLEMEEEEFNENPEDNISFSEAIPRIEVVIDREEVGDLTIVKVKGYVRGKENQYEVEEEVSMINNIDEEEFVQALMQMEDDIQNIVFAKVVLLWFVSIR